MYWIAVLISECQRGSCIIQLMQKFIILKEYFKISRPERKLRRELLSFLCTHHSLSFQQEIFGKGFFFFLILKSSLANKQQICTTGLPRQCQDHVASERKRENVVCTDTEMVEQINNGSARAFCNWKVELFFMSGRTRSCTICSSAAFSGGLSFPYHLAGDCVIGLLTILQSSFRHRGLSKRGLCQNGFHCL